jgi:hypothetical protein
VSSDGARTCAATSPSTAPSSPITGTCATTVRPSGLPTQARPSSAVESPGSKREPTRPGSGEVRTSRAASTMTMSSAPDRFRALVANTGSGP